MLHREKKPSAFRVKVLKVFKFEKSASSPLCSLIERISSVHQGYIRITSEDLQCIGNIMIHFEGHHEHIRHAQYI